MRLGIGLVSLVVVVGLVGVGRVQAGTIYVSRVGNDANDGFSWATAKLTVQAGLNAAVSGDQLWVAAGIYVERITLKAGVALYGGFAGSRDRPRHSGTGSATTRSSTVIKPAV